MAAVAGAIATTDVITSRWYVDALRAALVAFPLSQALAAMFRLVSNRHETR